MLIDDQKCLSYDKEHMEAVLVVTENRNCELHTGELMCLPFPHKREVVIDTFIYHIYK